MDNIYFCAYFKNVFCLCQKNKFSSCTCAGELSVELLQRETINNQAVKSDSALQLHYILETVNPL